MNPILREDLPYTDAFSLWLLRHTWAINGIRHVNYSETKKVIKKLNSRRIVGHHDSACELKTLSETGILPKRHGVTACPFGVS